MDYSENFLTIEQLEKLIEIPVSSFREMLSPYVYFKGLVYGLDHEIIYVDGYFLIEHIGMSYAPISPEERENDYLLSVPDNSVCETLIKITGTKFSNNDDLIDVVLTLKSSQDIDLVFYSYSQLGDVMKTLGCPEPKSLNELSKKNYTYDLKLMNQKSNFTLEEACKIAANAIREETEQHQQALIGLLPPLVAHYQEVISECVKGQNQHEFHLITQELWVHSYDYDRHEPCSRKFDNGTRLVFSSKVNLELTLISKAEFVRWCKYMDIDIGLSCNQKLVDESVEALMLKIEKLEKTIDEQTLEIIDLSFTDNPKEKHNNSYPPELQLAIDAYKQLCVDKEKLPTNKTIEVWLEKESKERGITHKDGSKVLKGLSNKKLETIPSILKS